MPRAPQRLTDRKREAIVRAAVEEFRAAGYEATSMDRIAEAAGVSKRTVYNHFPSKEALFSMILEELWERSVASDTLPYRADQPLQAQLLQLLGQKLELLSDANFIDLARVAMAEIIHSPERAQAIVCRMGEKESGESAWIRAAIADGRLREVDPEFAGHQLHGLVKSFAFWPQVTMGQAPLNAEGRARVAESAVAMFLGFYAV
ncbi:TPA: TetR/AcrR family transcriptional regulator [Stenotrophomonas maltophilia]|uniref:TetR/AcrR family transcriptional regulator n=1 Tax=Stenotrophomonas maltophilia TaxID=40324 RepID=UPI000B4E599A|nr:TetR/AcrR family transcriptional regulator [Stenotrophomonas maltophilia]MBA0316180.1 TetR/AcrR family transcriptional regulator [Stenotrophomonas maltophilia]OWQ59876.1 TetR family transcriptional regulator [Stenotrophomonas maltophilia]HEL3241679.1 TetR/AcrR family transcriptional regulator [Stenotrophomonas maltophilia]HEL3245539.1 TetR/AcrR family transcriptional regulator [Stenotrophomonas maltophilia]HEL3251503.1 TetR/AcrR family transcriptional regulator [Stenotrophomonas maltophilia